MTATFAPPRSEHVQRDAALAAIRAIQALDYPRARPVAVTFDGDFTNAQTVPEGAILGTFAFEQFKSPKGLNGDAKNDNTTVTPRIWNMPPPTQTDPDVQPEWQTGISNATAQNMARELAETPANLMNPTHFCQYAQRILAPLDHVEVRVHGPEWIAKQGMHSFLSVAQGSDQPARFLELLYKVCACLLAVCVAATTHAQRAHTRQHRHQKQRPSPLPWWARE
jgi:leucyl aminopeptidase